MENAESELTATRAENNALRAEIQVLRQHFNFVDSQLAVLQQSMKKTAQRTATMKSFFEIYLGRAIFKTLGPKKHLPCGRVNIDYGTVSWLEVDEVCVPSLAEASFQISDQAQASSDPPSSQRKRFSMSATSMDSTQGIFSDLNQKTSLRAAMVKLAGDVPVGDVPVGDVRKRRARKRRTRRRRARATPVSDETSRNPCSIGGRRS